MTITRTNGGGGGGSGTLTTVKDEGTNLSTAATSMDFVGAGVTATGGPAITVTIPGAAITLITETVLGGTSSNVSFTSIPSTYRDLIVVVRGRGDKSASASCEVRLRMNNDTGSNYDYQMGLMNQSNDADVEGRAQTYILLGYLTAATAPSNMPGAICARIYDYRGTTFYKPLTSQNDLPAVVSSGGFIYNNVSVGDYRSSSAVNRVDVFPDSGNFIDGDVFTLYGCL